MAKFIDPGEKTDLGAYGYSAEMYVISAHAVTEEWLVENNAPRMQAQALLDSEAWHIRFAEREDNTGLVDDIYLHKDDAVHFAVGDKVTYHYKRDVIPGFGKLAYIEREPKTPALSMG
ncbi:hypothetical protein [Rhizobium sp. MHM7A]|uniref:hypothetical protein n=1 Tax=Rhizobium sp. MHM7A TaxID=2583233 RepID=UPI00110597A8|nr:hypothetical protein [Rhizobium sp. MHM7A]TLX16027.1 hypothetical protein FFR93_01530 [Rhizobium sp. MHM7A]